MDLFVIKRAAGAVYLCCVLTACSSAPESGSDDQETTPVVVAAASCPESLAAECVAIRDDIKRLAEKRDAAQARDDWAAVARISLTINERHELLGLIADDKATDAAREAIRSKYKALNRMLVQDLKSTDSTVITKVPGMVYHPLEVEAVGAVTKKFGELFVDASDPAVDAGFQELHVAMPWSGYWYPLRGTDLFANDDSPLKKLDRVLEAAGRTSGAATKELEYHQMAQADSWEGLCGAWALASANTQEPTEPRTIGDVTFSVLDQKALLTKIHERAPSTFYGIRYFGDADTDGTIQDLRPEAFHNLFVHMLGEQKRAFVIDDDPSVEVWSKPVYRVRWSITQDPDRSDAFVVKAYPWMIRHREALSDAPTSLSDRSSVVYEYRLFVDKSKKTSKGYRVVAGEWINDSRNAHPDAAMISEAGAPASLNPIINESMDLVRQIVNLP